MRWVIPFMIDYNEQKSKYLWLIQNLKNYNFETNIVAKITDWDAQTGVTGFPNAYSLRLEYKDIPESNMDLIFYLDQDGMWSRVEIMSIDITERKRLQGLGRRLINYAINIAKEIGAKRIFGDVLDQNDYSSAGFYKKCGFEVYENSKPRTFCMDLHI